MKKIIAWMLITVLSVSMTACSKNDDKKEIVRKTTVAESSVKQKEISQGKQTKKEKAEKKKKQTTKDKQTTEKKKKAESKSKSSKKSEKNSKQKKQTSTSQQKKTTTEAETKKQEEFCQISIECNTVLHNKDKLKSNYQIPSGGKIYSGRIKIEDGDTVMTVLRKTGVNIDDSKGYVQGIDGLYEFDCGRYSGWMYKVNGSFSNVGAGKCTVQNGDNIQWLYTCERGDI